MTAVLATQMEATMQLPMREKYVDEAVGVWFIFGEHPTNGTVDVSDGQRDVFTSIPRDVANRIIDAQAAFRDVLYQNLSNFKETP